MKKSLSVAALVWLAVISGVSCDKFRPPPQLQKPSTTTAPVNPQEDERSTFAQPAQKELDALKVTIAQFKAKAEAQAPFAAVKTATRASCSEMTKTFSRSLEKRKSGGEHFRKAAACR